MWFETWNSENLDLDLQADEELYTWARTQTPKESLVYYGSPLFATGPRGALPMP